MKKFFVLMMLVLVVGFLVSIVFLFPRGGMTGFAVFEQGEESKFDEGIYSGTEWNGSAIILSSGQTSGTYTSKVFDASNDATWNSLTHVSATPDVNFLYGVDGGGDVYLSSDLAVSWSLAKEDYGRTSDTQEMFSDSSYLYIISNSNKELWRSGDGVTWEVINNIFADSGLLVGEVDSSENLYVADASGDVYLSTDSGVTWTLQGDFNGAATNNAKGMGIDSSGGLYVVDGDKDVYYSSNSGVDWVQKTEDHGAGGISLDDLEVDSSDYLYLLDNSDVWKSTDSGTTWAKINDDFSPYINDGCKMFIDSSDNFYIADCSGRVFKSTDSGVNWQEKGDLNLGAGNDIKGITDFAISTSLDFQVRSCDDSDCSGESWIDIEDSSPQDLSLDNNRYFQYKVSFTSPDSSVSPYLESASIDYDLVNSAPSIALESPQDGASYGYNESLELNFIASDVDDNIDSCWYVLNSGDIVILAGCANTTIDVPEGSNTLTIYVNDTQGEQASDSATFSVQVGAPSINLHSPVNSYLSSTSVIFRYTPTDLDLDSCELWGDFTGDFSLNQTDTSPTSGSENTFSLSLPDRTYFWNIKCNDSIGNSATNGNKTFYVDTTNPSLSLTQPTGTKTSRTGIPLTFAVTDASPVSCLYNIKWSTGELVISNTSIANCTGITFSVSADGSYVLNLYVNDSAGNTNFTSSSFNVDTSTPSNPPSGGSSGGGGGGNYTTTGNYDVEFSGISDLVLDPGETRRMSVTAENTGKDFLNDCVIRSKGVNSEWSTSSDVQDIGSGQLQEFTFSLDIPLSINEGSYPVELALECKEFSKSFDFFVEIIEKKLEIKLLDAKREKDDEITIYYSLTELSGNNQEVEVNIMLLGLKNEKIAEISEIKNIEAGSKNDFNAVLKIDSELKGNFNLIISVKSGITSSFIQEDIYIGSPSLIGGLAIFLGDERSNYLINALLIIGFFIFCILMIRRILKTRALAGLTGYKGHFKKDSRYGVIEIGKNIKKANKGKKKKV